jgi:hypothetical protein
VTLTRVALALRALLLGRASKVAMRAERRVLDAACRFDPLPPSLRARSALAGEEPEGWYPVGRFVDEPERNLLLPLRGEAVHRLVLGGTGVGKSRLIAGLMRAKLERFARAPARADRVCVLDPKSDMAEITKLAIAGLVATASEDEREALLGRLVVVAPFSTSSLVPMNILHVDRAEDIEANAWELTSLIPKLAGAPMGVHQDGFLFSLLSLGSELARSPSGCSLFDLVRLIDEPQELRTRGLASANANVRDYFGRNRIQPASLQGVRARIASLLRLPTSRMFAARTCVSFPNLLREQVGIVDIGAPLGSSDIAGFFLGLYTSRLFRAVNQRSTSDVPVDIVLDEWQRVARSAAWTATELEDALAICRARNVSLTLATQDLAAVREVSPSLVRVLASNVSELCAFRVNRDDARTLAESVYATGRRPRPSAPPWEQEGAPFLSAMEERASIVEALPRLPHRRFFFLRRDGGEGGVLVDAATVDAVRPAGLGRDLWRRIERGSLRMGPTVRLDAPPGGGGSPSAARPAPRPSPRRGQVRAESEVGSPRLPRRRRPG